MVPIPGTRKLERLEENLGAVDVEPTANDLREIEGPLKGQLAITLPTNHCRCRRHSLPGSNNR